MTAYHWLVIFTMAVITYGLRVSFLLLHEKLSFPPVVQRALRYVPYAVLAALVMPAVFVGDLGRFELEPARVVAAITGALIAWRTGSVILTLTLGMASLWAVQLLLLLV